MKKAFVLMERRLRQAERKDELNDYILCLFSDSIFKGKP